MAPYNADGAGDDRAGCYDALEELGDRLVCIQSASLRKKTTSQGPRLLPENTGEVNFFFASYGTFNLDLTLAAPYSCQPAPCSVAQLSSQLKRDDSKKGVFFFRPSPTSVITLL